MSVNKVFLEKCGLSVGTTQLNASGCGVTVGKNLEVNGTLYTNNLQSNQLTISNWTTSTRPTNPVNGAMGYNTQLATVEYYFNGNWFAVSSRNATGYLITIVAVGGGGGGGGPAYCGGGGAGLGQTTLSVQSPSKFVVTVGASGAANAAGGTDSYFCSPTVVKGGGGVGGACGRTGGSYYGKCTGSPGGNGSPGSGGLSGGSGGGAGGYGGTGACGSPARCSPAPQTYPTGLYALPGNHGGGGGGGGTNGNFWGGSPGSYAANGAAGGGTGIPFPGANGAGGSNYTGNCSGSGGAGGAGSCGCGTSYGGGGYGGHGGNSPSANGAGGPGAVALYYYSSFQRGVGGNVTTGTNGLGQYWVHKFTSSGTYSA